MKIRKNTGVWKYNDDKKQTAYFRGYMYYFAGKEKYYVSSEKVRDTRAEAEKDANKLYVKWKKQQ